MLEERSGSLETEEDGGSARWQTLGLVLDQYSVQGHCGAAW